MLRLIRTSKMGPKPNFSDAEVYWAMYLMSRGKRICRKDLAEQLGVGEGTVRTIISILHEADVIDTYQTGNVLSSTGRALMSALPMEPVDVNVPNLSVGPVRQALHVRGAAGNIWDGWVQRDTGIKVGGNGCTTLVDTDGHLIMPPSWDLDTGNPDEATAIRKVLDLREGDVLVIGSGNNVIDARRVAITVALSIV